jgi:hypothetical protein
LKAKAKDDKKKEEDEKEAINDHIVTESKKE